MSDIVRDAISWSLNDFAGQDLDCFLVHAELLVYSEVLTTSELAAILTHDRAETNADAIKRHISAGSKPPASMWLLDSRSVMQEHDINVHLDWLIGEMFPRQVQLKSLQQMSHVRMGVRCWWWTRSDGAGFCVSSNTLRALADLKLELGCIFRSYSEGNSCAASKPDPD